MSDTGRRSGAASRRAILARASALSAAAGPEGVTIGALARALGISKSGLFAHFGSKEALDLAVVHAAVDDFTRAVMAPAQAAPGGVARLAALVEGWLGEVQAGSATLAVLGPGRIGAAASLRAQLAAWRATWRAALAAEVAEARRTGELGAGTDAAQTAFEIDALLAAAAAAPGADTASAITAARRAIEIRLQHLATER